MVVSAQVILKSKEPVEAARLLFREGGFELGPYVGISFSISGPPERFERFFGVRLGEMASLSFPLENLAGEVRESIEAVTFTPPPAFGPSGSGP